MSAQVTGDLRSQGVEQRRDREHRIKYHFFDPKLMGKTKTFYPGNKYQFFDPIDPLSPDLAGKMSSRWNDSNKYRMGPFYMTTCRCTYCRKDRDRGLNKQHKFCIVNRVHNTKAFTSNKRRLPALNCETYVDDFREVDDYSSIDEKAEDDGFIGGVTYSFDAAKGPGHGGEMHLSHAVSQAIEKFETQELVNLIKNEYDLVSEADTDEDFEFI